MALSKRKPRPSNHGMLTRSKRRSLPEKEVTMEVMEYAQKRTRKIKERKPVENNPGLERSPNFRVEQEVYIEIYRAY